MIGTGVKTDSEVSDATEGRGHHDTEGHLRADLGPEVRADSVHIIVDFTKENWTFIGENKNDILNSVHGDVHGHEEERTLQVLENLLVLCGSRFGVVNS